MSLRTTQPISEKERYTGKPCFSQGKILVLRERERERERHTDRQTDFEETLGLSNHKTLIFSDLPLVLVPYGQSAPMPSLALGYDAPTHSSVLPSCVVLY